jgi:phage terminase small subunit
MAKFERTLPFEHKFVSEYCKDFNAARAMVRAGSKLEGANLRVEASKLSRRPSVVKAVKEYLRGTTTQADVTIKRVLREYELLAFSDITDYTVDSEGRLMVDDEVMAPEKSRAVQSVKQRFFYDQNGNVTRGETEIKLWSKTQALEALAKIHQMIIEHHEHTGPNGGPIQVGVITPDQAANMRAQILGYDAPALPEAQQEQLEEYSEDIVDAELVETE